MEAVPEIRRAASMDKDCPAVVSEEESTRLPDGDTNETGAAKASGASTVRVPEPAEDPKRNEVNPLPMRAISAAVRSKAAVDAVPPIAISAVAGAGSKARDPALGEAAANRRPVKSASAARSTTSPLRTVSAAPN